MSKLLAGQIGKPHGLAGEVYVVRISDDPRCFEAGSRMEHADGTPLTVASSHVHGGTRFLVRFQGVDSRDAAERLRGALYVVDLERRALEDDEYWQKDLVGCLVITSDGASVGEVTGVTQAPAQDLLVVATQRGERMIPLVKEIVPEVDVTARRIVVDPPEGLLD